MSGRFAWARWGRWRVLLVEGLLEVRKVTFSSNSSRKWPCLWLVGENLDRSWLGALLCQLEARGTNLKERA